MKAYTDLKQSKALAKILPLESADMFYADLLVDGVHKYNLHPLESYGFKTFEDTKLKASDHLGFVPCWSLAALIDVLPLEVETHRQTDGHKTYYYVESYMRRMGEETYLSTERHESLVDACYEMILKLYEQKLL